MAENSMGRRGSLPGGTVGREDYSRATFGEALLKQGFLPAWRVGPALGISQSTLSRWIYLQKVEARKVASRWYVSVPSLEAHLGEDIVGPILRPMLAGQEPPAGPGIGLKPGRQRGKSAAPSPMARPADTELHTEAELYTDDEEPPL